MSTLESLMGHIAAVWVCDPERYPALAGMDDAQRRMFLVKHSLLHVSKTVGKVAAVCEDFDHAGVKGAESAAALQDGVVKLFVNALKLAEETGLSAEDLLRRAPEFVK